MATQLIECYRVCIPHTYHDFFDYTVADNKPKTGARVWVPFRNKRRVGIVIAMASIQPPDYELKSIQSIIDADEPVLTKDMLELAQWISRYYQSPLSEVIPLFLPKKYREGQPQQLKMTDSYQLTTDVQQARDMLGQQAKKQRQLVDYFYEHSNRWLTKTHLRQAGFTTQQLKALIDRNLLQINSSTDLPFPPQLSVSDPLTLNDEQRFARETILSHIDAYNSFLLQGVTGSGKTEVYLQVISEVLQRNRQILILVPEIGLTPQLLERFRSRIAHPIAIIHSGLNDTERQQAWQLAKEQQVKLIIGTRAAIFTPMPRLGLIIIDEEHDSSLKQMEGVRYSARDTALIRAQRLNIPVILGSATPSLESLYNCQRGKYQLLQLQQKALTQQPLRYQLIDIRSQALEQGFAAVTLQAIQQHLQSGQQVMVFINRRGFSPVLLCHHCGWMADCSACDSHLTLHRRAGYLSCHHCGRQQKVPSACGHCASEELIPIGMGTQRVETFLSSRFAEHTVLRIDRDEVQKKHTFDEHLQLIHSGQAQLLIGTQMLAKGHHFPNLSLVVILDADAGFYNQDFRAIERLGQLITQVAGRAGRAEKKGEVLIQTHLPQHPLLNTLVQNGYEDFAKQLLITRKEAELPPYQYLAILRAQAKTAQKVLSFLHQLKKQIPSSSVTIMGPAPAPLAKKAHQHRMQLLLKAPSRSLLNSTLLELRKWIASDKPSAGVQWNIDVDPQDLA